MELSVDQAGGPDLITHALPPPNPEVHSLTTAVSALKQVDLLGSESGYIRPELETNCH